MFFKIFPKIKIEPLSERFITVLAILLASIKKISPKGVLRTIKAMIHCNMRPPLTSFQSLFLCEEIRNDIKRKVKILEGLLSSQRLPLVTS